MLKVKLSVRFSYLDILLLLRILQFPVEMRTTSNEVFSGKDALMIMLYRLAVPLRWVDVQNVFGRDKAALSRVSAMAIDYIFENWSHLITSLNHPLLTPHMFERAAGALRNAGCPFTELVGFIDAKILLIARPGEDQRVYYNGYAKGHALKFQFFVMPNGLVIHCSEAIEGRRGDGALLAQSRLAEMLSDRAKGFSGRQMFVYGDPAYAEKGPIISGLKKVENLTQEERNLNSWMSKYRESVEWGIGKTIMLWGQFSRIQTNRVGSSPIGREFLVAVLLTNAHTILYGSEIGSKFRMDVPTLNEYFVQ